MKIVKTDWRSRLNEKNLSDLLRIRVEGPGLSQFAQYGCEEAVNLWHNAKQRRFTGKRKYKSRVEKKKRQKFTNEFVEQLLETSSSSEEDEDID